jgi:hypothetical protein
VKTALLYFIFEEEGNSQKSRTFHQNITVKTVPDPQND